MRALASAAAAAFALAVAGPAHADSFVVLPSEPRSLPSAEVPNAPGSIGLPVAFTTPPSVAQDVPPASLEPLWRSAGDAYGVPWNVLAAINKIESDFGRNMGPSSAGAVGWMQFMPSTWLRWGTDANGDGIADPWNAEDAIYSAARYLAAAGGLTDIERAVFAYNHADWYVDDVLELAELYGRGGADVTFSLDRLELDLEAANRELATVAAAIEAARRQERAFARQAARILERAARARLLSDRLALQKLAGAAAARQAAAAARVAALEADLETARTSLQAAQDEARAASFAPAAQFVLGGPSYSGEYVFPVGGGPSVASVARTHHDYPAADIAAPTGTPVYALADGTVVSAWHTSDGRCGIGFALATADGQTWVYCHLSYLDPFISDGVAVAAGAQMGLVGSTGRSTGPHLHLQLKPASAYPQEQAWFQSFAGSAFRWQDGPAVAAEDVAQPVFAVVPGDSAPEPESADTVLFTR